MKKYLVAATVASTVALVGAGGVALAATTASDSKNGQQSLVTTLAEKFNLSKNDVQKVVDEHRAEVQKAHQAKVDEKLIALVKDGSLTQTQVDAIKAKRAELQKTHEAAKEKAGATTQEARDAMKQTMDKERAALEQWAKDNGIDTKYLHFVFMHGKAPGGPGHGGQPPAQGEAPM